MITNLTSNFINTNNNIQHENNLLLDYTRHPLFPFPHLKKLRKWLEWKKSDFQLHQKSYGLRNLNFFYLSYQEKKIEEEWYFWFFVANISKEILIKNVWSPCPPPSPLVLERFCPPRLQKGGGRGGGFLIWAFLLHIFDTASHLMF